MRHALELFILGITLVGCNQYAVQSSGGPFTDLASAEQRSCYYNIASNGELVSWAPSVSTTFYLEENVPEEFADQIRAAARIWQTSLGQNMINISSERVRSSNTQSDSKNIIYWYRSPGYFNNYEQARTVTRWKRAQIFDSDIVINALDFVFFGDQKRGNNELHLKSLMVHEFGHSLGMRHISSIGSVMFPNLAYSEIRFNPSDLDIKSLRCEYP